MNSYEELINRVPHSRAASYVYGNSMPNILIGVDAVNENPVPAEEKWFKEIVEDVIFAIAETSNKGISARYQFCANPKYIATLDAVFKQFHLAHTEGNQQLVIGAAHGRADLSDTLAVLDIIAEEENLGKLTKAPAFVDAQNELRARQRKISEMTSGGAKNFSVRTGNSNSIRYDGTASSFSFPLAVGPSCGKGFDAMSDSEIDALYQSWITEQRYKQMTPAQLKEIVRNGVQQAYQDRTGLDPNTNTPISRATEQLLDPRDGSPITTRRQLIAYINSSQDASKRLLCTPQGKSIPQKIRAFEALLNSR